MSVLDLIVLWARIPPILQETWGGITALGENSRIQPFSSDLTLTVPGIQCVIPISTRMPQ